MTRPVAIITGASSGIGAACAAAMAESHDVVLVARGEDRLAAVAEKIGAPASWERADVTQADEVERFIEQVIVRLGRIDVVVNCAGAGGARVTTTTPLQEALDIWETQMRLNATSVFMVCMAAAPHLPRPGGRIINIGSAVVYSGGRRAGSMAYVSAKAAMSGLTRALARELSPEGITVNTVSPGFVEGTDNTRGWPAERVRDFLAATATGRPGRASEVAAAVRFLSSPDAGYITGQTLGVDGGIRFS
jgi:3-oxoacyl-[acyl-carrier protein] reductase